MWLECIEPRERVAGSAEREVGTAESLSPLKSFLSSREQWEAIKELQAVEPRVKS